MNRIAVSAMIACLLALGALALTGCPKAPAPEAAVPVTAAAAGGEDLTCPVMGGPADKDNGLSYEYKGKTYHFCCPPCLEKFKADPEKYLQKGEQAATEAACPVTGKDKPEGVTCPLGDTHQHGAEHPAPAAPAAPSAPSS